MARNNQPSKRSKKPRSDPLLRSLKPSGPIGQLTLWLDRAIKLRRRPDDESLTALSRSVHADWNALVDPDNSSLAHDLAYSASRTFAALATDAEFPELVQSGWIPPNYKAPHPPALKKAKAVWETVLDTDGFRDWVEDLERKADERAAQKKRRALPASPPPKRQRLASPDSVTLSRPRPGRATRPPPPPSYPSPLAKPTPKSSAGPAPMASSSKGKAPLVSPFKTSRVVESDDEEEEASSEEESSEEVEVVEEEGEGDDEDDELVSEKGRASSSKASSKKRRRRSSSSSEVEEISAPPVKIEKGVKAPPKALPSASWAAGSVEEDASVLHGNRFQAVADLCLHEEHLGPAFRPRCSVCALIQGPSANCVGKGCDTKCSRCASGLRSCSCKLVDTPSGQAKRDNHLWIGALAAPYGQRHHRRLLHTWQAQERLAASTALSLRRHVVCLVDRLSRAEVARGRPFLLKHVFGTEENLQAFERIRRLAIAERITPSDAAALRVSVDSLLEFLPQMHETLSANEASSSEPAAPADVPASTPLGSPPQDRQDAEGELEAATGNVSA
ncbi:hypothetical protein CC2G_002293 [Coprinopsis cinerea AmutBmut pab1-1]|nr:hypothetical protein CC2G_002293 [Coprinopsis cinerea AmutBmut pab1-1]